MHIQSLLMDNKCQIRGGLQRFLLTVLVDEHADRDAAHVEAVQEILDILVGDRVLWEDLFIFDDALGHGWHHIVVPVSDGDQGVYKSAQERHDHGPAKY